VDKEIKDFYERILSSTLIPKKYFGIKSIIRMQKIKVIYGLKEDYKSI